MASNERDDDRFFTHHFDSCHNIFASVSGRIDVETSYRTGEYIMRLTHLDILEQCFHDKFRGYNKDEVDTFLHLVADDYKEMTEEIHQLKTRLTEKERRLKQNGKRGAEKEKSEPSGAEELAELTPAFIKNRANNILSTAREQAENHIFKGLDVVPGFQFNVSH